MDREKQICGFLTKRINISVIFCKVKRTQKCCSVRVCLTIALKSGILSKDIFSVYRILPIWLTRQWPDEVLKMSGGYEEICVGR